MLTSVKRSFTLALPFFLTLSAITWSAPSHAVNLIRTYGRAEKKVQPDIAWLNVQIWAKGKNAKKAQSLSAEEYQRIEKLLLKEFKLDKKNIKTQGMNLAPEYEYRQNKRVVTGYSGNHSLQITVRDLEQLGPMVDSLITSKSADSDSGVNVENISFGTEKSEAYETEVLELAMKNARVKADAIARAAGKSIKGVYGVAHGPIGGPVIPMFERPMMTMKSEAADARTAVPAGEITVSTELTVEYEM